MARAWRQNDEIIGRKRAQRRLVASASAVLFEIEVILSSFGLLQLAAGQRQESWKI